MLYSTVLRDFAYLITKLYNYNRFSKYSYISFFSVPILLVT